MTTLSYFTLSFALTLWLSRFLLKYMDPSFFMDHPTERKLHDRPKPRFGGLAFSPIIIILGWFLLNGNGQLTWYFLGALSMFILGAVDDYWSISWHYKLPVQIIVGFLVVVQFFNQVTSVSFFSHSLPLNQWLLIGFFVFWFVGILNALNLIDGMDGLAGGFVFLTSFGCIILGWLHNASAFIYLNAIIMGAMIAFLHFNQRPSKFFMGDSGSLFLGFHVATLPLQLFVFVKNPITLDITPFVLLTSYLIIDTIRVFYVRISNKRHPLEPDQSHLHHLMYHSCGSYNGTLLTIYFILGISGIMAIFYTLKTFQTTAMVIYLSIIFGFVFIPQILDKLVLLVSRVIRLFRENDFKRYPFQTFMRIRYLPYIYILYFIGILFVTPGINQVNAISVLLVISGLIIIAFIFSVKSITYQSELIIIGLGIAHAILLSRVYTNGYINENEIITNIGYILRYSCLIYISTVTFMNYILYGKKIPSEFWSATDLLVIILLIGLASVQTLGVGIPVIMSFELGVLYLGNKLYVPRLLMGSLAPQSQNI